MKSALNQHVLVLNRLWQAVNVCTARRALTLLFQGHAQVVTENLDGSFRTFNFDEWRDVSASAPHEDSINAISFRIRLPRIILLFMYDRMPKKEVKFTRHNIFERDKNTCQYCGEIFDRKDLNLDHVIPRDRGGMTWSRFRSFRSKISPQYWQVFLSRSKMLCRVNFTSFFGIRSYMKSRMMRGRRMRKEMALMESSCGALAETSRHSSKLKVRNEPSRFSVTTCAWP